jgi:hypothetical protein
VIVREERPHPGAQLRFTDIDGYRVTCFATDARGGQLADLELRHRRRARCAKAVTAHQPGGLSQVRLMNQSPGRSNLSRSASLRANTIIMNVGFAWLEVRKAELLATNRLLMP